MCRSPNGLFTCLALCVLGCDAEPGPPSGSASPELEPTLDSIQQHVFQPACVEGCHDAASEAGSLNLSDAAASYEALVSVPATNVVAATNGWLRVKPHEPELSFLSRKLHLPGIGEGGAMPVGEEQLTEYYRALVDDWIAEGALP